MNIPYSGNPGYDMYDKHHVKEMYDYCNKHKYDMIGMEMKDGNVYEGIIETIESDAVYLLIPIGDLEDTDDDRQFGFGYDYGYGPGGGYGYGGYGYGYPRRFRRFRRYRFPFGGIGRFFFPFFF